MYFLFFMLPAYQPRQRQAGIARHRAQGVEQQVVYLAYAAAQHKLRALNQQRQQQPGKRAGGKSQPRACRYSPSGMNQAILPKNR